MKEKISVNSLPLEIILYIYNMLNSDQDKRAMWWVCKYWYTACVPKDLETNKKKWKEDALNYKRENFFKSIKSHSSQNISLIEDLQRLSILVARNGPYHLKDLPKDDIILSKVKSFDPTKKEDREEIALLILLLAQMQSYFFYTKKNKAEIKIQLLLTNLQQEIFKKQKALRLFPHFTIGESLVTLTRPNIVPLHEFNSLINLLCLPPKRRSEKLTNYICEARFCAESLELRVIPYGRWNALCIAILLGDHLLAAYIKAIPNRSPIDKLIFPEELTLTPLTTSLLNQQLGIEIKESKEGSIGPYSQELYKKLYSHRMTPELLIELPGFPSSLESIEGLPSYLISHGHPDPKIQEATLLCLDSSSKLTL